MALLCELGSPEDAVALALTTDMGLATSVAARSDNDPLRQRHLWIAIARDIVSRPAPEVAPLKRACHLSPLRKADTELGQLSSGFLRRMSRRCVAA